VGNLAALGNDGKIGWQTVVSRGRNEIRELVTEHRPGDTTNSKGFVGVGVEISYTSRNRNKVCWTL